MTIPKQACAAEEDVLIELPVDDLDRARPVLAAALSLFGPGTRLVLWSPARPDEETARALGALCRQLAGGAPAMTIELLDAATAADLPARLSVAATGDPMSDARAIVLLAGLAFQDWGLGAGAGAVHQAEAARVIASRDALAAVRDRAAPRDQVPTVAVVAQVQSTWGAVRTVCDALGADPRVRLEVVAVDSEHEPRATSTADYLRSLGHAPRDVPWLAAQLADRGSSLAAVLFYDPWDDLRPSPARATDVAEAGVRIAYLPYGNNVGAGEHLETIAYDLPMHRLAWRVFARSERSRAMFATNCAVGAAHVRVAGTPKFDRVVRLSGVPPLPTPPARATVLWNPHFSFGPDGFSTFDRYLGPMIEYAVAHPRLCLVVRPHFRLLRDLPLMGAGGARLLSALQRAAEHVPGIVLDTSSDYLPAFAAADAMVSDLSSLISEFVLTRRPCCYLHREDGPGANEDSEYLFEGAVATSWPGVAAFLDQVLRDTGPIRRAEDVGAQARDLLVRRHFPLDDGRAGERVASEIVDGLLAERAAVGAEVSGERVGA